MYRNTQPKTQNIRRAICTLLVFALLMLLPVKVFAENSIENIDASWTVESSPPTAFAARCKVFANGSEIIMVAGAKLYHTNILYDADGDGVIGLHEYLQIGNEAPTADGYDLSGFSVYGGAEYGALDCDTKITMYSGSVFSIYGGSFGDYSGVCGDTHVSVQNDASVRYIYGGGSGKESFVIGSCNVNISNMSTGIGGTYYGSMGEIYGGGEGAKAIVGSTNISVKDAVIRTNIYGGGNGEGAAVFGDTTIAVSNSAAEYKLFGGGRGRYSAVGGSTRVTIDNSSFDCIFGGNSGAGSEVRGDTFVNVLNHSKADVIYGGGTYYDEWDKAYRVSRVFGNTNVLLVKSEARYVAGGSGGTKYSIAEVSGKASVKITENSCVEKYLFGGGEYCNVGSAEVEISASRAWCVFGGSDGKGSVIVGDCTISADASSITGSIYGGGWKDTIQGSTYIKATDAVIQGLVHGGVFGDGAENGDVHGDSEIDLLRCRVYDSVLGAGKFGGIYGNVSVRVDDCVVDNRITGGDDYGLCKYAEILLKGNTKAKHVFAGKDSDWRVYIDKDVVVTEEIVGEVVHINPQTGDSLLANLFY